MPVIVPEKTTHDKFTGDRLLSRVDGTSDNSVCCFYG